MARDIERRLKSLDSRRRGTDRLGQLSLDSAQQILAKSFVSESYAKRAPALKNTRYALGAMQAVDSDYTKISLEEAIRVGAQLETGLSKLNIEVQFRLQGSVPCDIHIRGVSDVDLLVLDDRYFRYDTEGVNAILGKFNNPVAFDTLAALSELRRHSETILTNAYPAAKVDTSGSKAIKLSGGSLRRPVDVVPSNWYDTQDFQLSGAEVDRGVHILNRDVPERVLNMPFRHIQRLNQNDSRSLGGLKKAIRLCKNVKADAIDEGAKINLSSFDIASALWHADLPALTVGISNELAILGEATRFLDFLARRPQYAATLKVPDGSRAIFDNPSKHEALIQLSLELDDLAMKVGREQGRLSEYAQLQSDQIIEMLRKAQVPA